MSVKMTSSHLVGASHSFCPGAIPCSLSSVIGLVTASSHLIEFMTIMSVKDYSNHLIRFDYA